MSLESLLECKIHNVDVAWVANKIIPFGVKNLSSTPT